MSKAKYNSLKTISPGVPLTEHTGSATTCPACVADREVYQVLNAAPDMLKALKFYADRLAFTHLDGECSAMCSDEGDIARDAVAKAILGS